MVEYSFIGQNDFACSIHTLLGLESFGSQHYLIEYLVLYC